MPTVLRSGAYRFYFFSNEPSRPNVHCQRDNKICKWWLEKNGCPHVSLKDAGEFSSKELKDIEKIVDIQLGALQKVLDQKHLTLTLSQEARDFLARTGYDPVYGARPLKRAIQQHLQNSLAMELLQGNIREGQRVNVDFDPLKDDLVFKPELVQ